MAILSQVFTIPSMVSGNSITSALEIPGTFLYMYLQVPTMTTGFNADTRIFIQGSADGTTFFRYSNVEVNTAGAGTNDFYIVSACSQRMVLIPNFAFRYMKVETTAVASAGVTAMTPFKVICVSNQ